MVIGNFLKKYFYQKCSDFTLVWSLCVKSINFFCFARKKNILQTKIFQFFYNCFIVYVRNLNFKEKVIIVYLNHFFSIWSKKTLFSKIFCQSLAAAVNNFCLFWKFILRDNMLISYSTHTKISGRILGQFFFKELIKVQIRWFFLPLHRSARSLGRLSFILFNPNPCGWGRIWLPKLWRGISLQRLK